MKQPKKPTRANKELISENRLRADNWMVIRESSSELEIIHKKSGKTRILKK